MAQADIGSLLQSILGGNAANTGIGTNPPSRTGPNPQRVATSIPGTAGSANSMASFWAALAPYLSLLTGSNAPGTSTSSTTTPAAAGTGTAAGSGNTLLQSLLAALMTPPSTSSPAAGIGGGGSTGGTGGTPNWMQAVFSSNPNVYGGGQGGGGSASTGAGAGPADSSGGFQGPGSAQGNFGV